MAELTRRRRGRSRRDDDDFDPTPDESANIGNYEDDDSPRSRRKSRDDEDTPRRGSRRGSRSRDDQSGSVRGSARRSRSSGDEEAPRRGRGNRSTGGFDKYRSKRRSNSKFAEDLKDSLRDNEPSLIKLLDREPFDTYNQHWIEDVPKGTRKSYVCYDDPDYFEDAEELGCPLCEIGDPASTYALWNALDLSNPRKPKVVVWKTSATLTDDLERMADQKRTSPLDREDLYLEVTRVVKGRNTRYKIEALKADDAADEYEFDPFTSDELSEYDDDKFEDRKAVTQVDSHEDLEELADSL